MRPMAGPLVLEVDGREVPVTHPDKLIFPAPGITKLDLVNYYLAVAGGALRGVADRPMILKRFVKGIDAEAIFQKRAPEKRPDWIDVAELKYRSGTSAKEAVLHDAAGLVWAVNLGCVDLNPHPVRAADLDHPDELRVDLDPQPGTGFVQARTVAVDILKPLLDELGLVGYPKTSGGRGIHVFLRIAPQACQRAVEAHLEIVELVDIVGAIRRKELDEPAEHLVAHDPARQRFRPAIRAFRLGQAAQHASDQDPIEAFEPRLVVVSTARANEIDETFARDVARVGALGDFRPGNQLITWQDR